MLKRFKSLPTPSQLWLTRNRSPLQETFYLPWRQGEGTTPFEHQSFPSGLRMTTTIHWQNVQPNRQPREKHGNWEVNWLHRSQDQLSTNPHNKVTWFGNLKHFLHRSSTQQRKHTTGDRKRNTITSLTSGKLRIFSNIKSSLKVQINMNIIITCAFLFFHLNQWVLDFWIIVSHHLLRICYNLPIYL